MNKIKISFIIPCYKVEKYLPKCLDSLMSQTLKEIEIICVNDGSPDGCLDILKKYKKKYGNKIVIIDKKNEGVWCGRMDGIKIARGEYIGFIDSDDTVRSEFAEKLYKAAVEHAADCVVCGFDRADLESEKILSREMCSIRKKILFIPEDLSDVISINSAAWNKIYKSSILKSLPATKHCPNVMEDVRLFELALINIKKIVFVSESLYNYYVRKNSIINTMEIAELKEIQSAAVEVRNIYKKYQPQRLEFVDSYAFLHFGISIMYRLSQNSAINLRKSITDNVRFLDREFPLWRKSKIYRKNTKLWISRQTYRFHIFKPFISFYGFVTNVLRIDIKW